MPWYPQSEAADLLNISTRTLRRRIRAGAVQWRRDGRHILVEVPDQPEPDKVSEIGRQLAQVGAASAIQRSRDSDIMASVMAVVTDFRQTLAQQATTARRSARLAWGTSLVMLAAVAMLGWTYHRATLASLDQLEQLKSEASRHEQGLQTEAARAEGHANALQQQLSVEHNTVNQLRAEVAQAADKVSVVSGQREQLRQERNRLVAELATASREHDQQRSSSAERDIELVAQLARAKGQVATLQKQLDHERKTTNVVRSMLASTADRVADVSAQLDHVVQNRDRLAIELATVSGQLHETANERNRLRLTLAAKQIGGELVASIGQLVRKAGQQLTVESRKRGRNSVFVSHTAASLRPVTLSEPLQVAQVAKPTLKRSAQKEGNDEILHPTSWVTGWEDLPVLAQPTEDQGYAGR